MSVRQLIDAIDSGKSLEIESTFEALMADKVATKLDAYRQEVAKNMFASKVEESKEEDEDEDEDDDKDDDKEDDDEDEDEDEKKEMKEGAYTNPGLEALAAKKRAEREAAAKAKAK